MTNRPYPPAYPHDPLVELFDGVFWVHGSVKMAPGLGISRNMIVLRDNQALTLVNAVRLNSVEEQKLLALGDVKHVVRLGDFHGLDDPYYVDKFAAEFWCQPGQSIYTSPAADHVISADAAPPVDNTAFFIFADATFPECALLLRQHRLLITADAIQHYSAWTHTTALARLLMPLLGFKKDLLIGKPWLKKVTPKGGTMRNDFERLLALDFEHLLAAHGSLLRDGAKSKLQEVVSKTFV